MPTEVLPSKSEPCGLAQMIACAYGTVPIVRSVGGLFDSIRNVGEPGANGFRFDNYNAHDLLAVFRRATALFGDRAKWESLRAAAKASDFSWEKSAEKYMTIYSNLEKW